MNPALSQSHFRILWIVPLAATMLTFAKVGHLPFSLFDDNVYIQQNFDLNRELSLATLRHIFVSPVNGMWHPITSLSFFVEYQVFGNIAGGYHITNFWLHLANTFLVWGVLSRLVKDWRLVLAVTLSFGLHPAQVESVAWISERKGLLGAFFSLLMVRCYFEYARTKQVRFFTATLVAYILGLLSKTSVIAMPLVLILLDWWPLQRVSLPSVLLKGEAKRILIFEKMPFLLLAVPYGYISYIVQLANNNVVVDVPFAIRIASVFQSYTKLVYDWAYPVHLTLLYPRPGAYPVGASILAIMCITVGTFLCIKSYPITRSREIQFGWWWFLLIVLPMAGFISYGPHYTADRYLYLSGIGLSLIIWSLVFRFVNATVAGVICALVMACYLCGSVINIGKWKSNEIVWKENLSVAGPNPVAFNNLGVAKSSAGPTPEAALLFKLALAENFNDGAALNLAQNMEANGRWRKAEQVYRLSLLQRSNPPPKIIFALGNNLLAQGRIEEARKVTSDAYGRDKEANLSNYRMGVFLLKVDNNRLDTNALNEVLEYAKKAVAGAGAYNYVYTALYAETLAKLGRQAEADIVGALTIRRLEKAEHRLMAANLLRELERRREDTSEQPSVLERLIGAEVTSQ